MIDDRKKYGFTLIEVLIALGIFAVFAVIINGILLNVFKNTAKQNVLKEVKQNGDVALTIMADSIRYATSIQGACNTTSSNITIVNKDKSTTTYEVMSDRIKATTTSLSGLVTEKFLTGDTLQVIPNGLRFTCISDPPANPLITIYFQLTRNGEEDGRTEYIASMEFQTSVYMRGITL